MKMIIILALSILTQGVFANNCAQDAKKLCPGVEPGRGQLALCLEGAGTLSPACAKELKEFKQKTAKKNPCFEDLAQLCPEVTPEAPLLEFCLLKNESRLSEMCSTDFKKKKSNIMARNVCAQDVVNHCYAQVTDPKGSVNHCLIANRNKLTKACQALTDKRIANIKKVNPCFDETQKLCSSFTTRVDLHDCLEKKIPSLSPQCKAMVQNEVKKINANPCYKDLMRHCVPNLNPKDQDDCLTLNDEHLTRACKDYRVKESDKVKKMVENCEADRVKFCSTALPQNAGIIKCLRKFKPKLQKACSDLI